MNVSIESHRSPIRTHQLEAENVGFLVAWQFARPGYNEGEFDVERKVVEQLFTEHGFAGALDASCADPVQALKQAAASGKKGSRIMVEPIELKGKDAPLVMGVYFQLARPEDQGGDEWVLAGRVRIEGGACVVRADAPVQLSAEQQRACLKVAEDVATRANHLLTRTRNNELSQSILAAGRSCFWAPFRKAGGVYWVPGGDAALRLSALLLALEKVGLFWPTVQPLFADVGGLTLRNVGAAAESTMLSEIKQLTDELAKAEAGKPMRESTVQARRQRCQQLVVQASVYRSVLAERAGVFAEALKDVHNRLGVLVGEIGDDSAFDGFGI